MSKKSELAEALAALEIIAGYKPLEDREHLASGLPLRIVELFYDEVMIINKVLTSQQCEEECEEDLIK